MMNSTPCQRTKIPARNSKSLSSRMPLKNPPVNAPANAGIPMAITILKSTRPPRQCLNAPDRALKLLTMILVPPAIAGGVPSNNNAGRRIVPSARPTKPPSTPTRREIMVSKTTFQINWLDGSPISSKLKVNREERVTSTWHLPSFFDVLIHDLNSPRTNLRQAAEKFPQFRGSLQCIPHHGNLFDGHHKRRPLDLDSMVVMAEPLIGRG